MDRDMDQFIHRENLAHYRRLLTESSVESDPVRHKLLIRLLADEEARPDVADDGKFAIERDIWNCCTDR
jgi:hypothetical protein